uniref:CHK kinase-like domain-containing protein n=1 Tax=Megaselia scalaris TaxID=36166 RepID=T1GJS7_MEGSC
MAVTQNVIYILDTLEILTKSAYIGGCNAYSLLSPIDSGLGGENFSSKVYRAVVNYKKGNCKETASLIVKCISYEAERAFLQTMDIYGTEVNIYKEIVPKLETILNEKLAPKFYISLENPIRTIVFEDLVEKGFEIGDRLKGLNFEQAKFVLEKLARFHAASAILAKKEPHILEKFKTHMFHNLKDHPLIVNEMFLKNFEYLIELVEGWDNFQGIASKLQKFKENFMEYAQRVIERDGMDLML